MKKPFIFPKILLATLCFLIVLGATSYHNYKLNSRVETLKNQVENLETMCNQYDVQISEMDEEIQTKETTIQNLESKTVTLTEQLYLSEKTLEEQKTIIDGLYDDANLAEIKRNHEIIENVYNGKNNDFNYAFYIPNGYNIDESKPLLVYLHGSGECGIDLGLLRDCTYGFSGFVYSGRLAPDCYILMPQCPGGYWGTNIDDIKDLIDELCETYNIDRSKISITGHSLGGWGAIDFVLKYPDLFSACAPMSASMDVTLASKIKIPFLFLVGELDSPQSFIDANNAINECGGNSEIIIYAEEGHIIPYHYLDDDYAIINWLISQ